MRKAKQQTFPFRSWGGKRMGCGRKLVSTLPSVPHRRRPEHKARFPLHIILRIHEGLPTLRSAGAHAAVLRSLVSASRRSGFAVVHYSLMPNHVHLICEAADQRSFRSGMAGLIIRMALALNRAWGRHGRVFKSRYFSRALRTPLEVHRALAYVLRNAEHHGIHVANGIDPFSSARWFEGWTTSPAPAPECSSPLPRAKTWLLTEVVKIHGAIDPVVEPRKEGKRKAKTR